MKRLPILPAVLLCACASETARSSYTLGPGVAAYDALAAATEKCRADGGQVELKNGYNKRDLSSYECKLGAVR
ncbi:MAG TPA: hypothetical protein VGI30_14965 [Caulobacteraceae bacterium]